MGISGFLKKVVELKKEDVAESQRIYPLTEIRYKAESSLKTGSLNYREPFLFLNSVKISNTNRVGIIAEIKKASPSKGDIKVDLDPAKYARQYTEAGACAISVLTERHYFKGSLDDLKAVRESTSLPILRKDFTLSEYQIYEAKTAGADSILLIAAMLSKEQLRDYVLLSRELGIEPLVEINSEWDIDKTLFADAEVVGINNRNLETLEVDLGVSKRIVPFLTQNQIPVEASGISSPDDIKKGLDSKIFNFLVGESIVRAENTKEFIQSLINSGLNYTNFLSNHDDYSDLSPNNQILYDDQGKKKNNILNFTKICGLTTLEDALLCDKAGADAAGFIFYPKSPRYIEPEEALKITSKLSDHIMTVGVFVDEDYDAVVKITEKSGIKGVQLHGNESPSLIQELKKRGLFVIKTLFTEREPHFSKAQIYNAADAVLVECGKGNLPGGNGESWDWSLAAPLVQTEKKQNGIKKIILAGGLSPDNIQKAIDVVVNPWGVDVSSGVEFSPGRKDIDKIKKLMNQIKKLGRQQVKDN